MTFTIKSESINGVYIEITQEKNDKAFTVSAYEIRENGTCGYPFTSLVYADLEKAKKRFNAIKRNSRA